MKKSIYKLLTSVSLLGLATSTTLTATPSVFANDVAAQKGTFTVGGSPINVRNDPSTAGEVIDTYQPGQLINYDQIVTANGYLWISYENASGQRRYVAIGTADGTASYGSLSAEGSSSASTSSSTDNRFLTDTAYMAGTWINGKGDKLVINADGTADFPNRQKQSWVVTYRFFKGPNNSLSLGGVDSNNQIPAGTASPTIPFSFAKAGEDFGFGGDASDISRDRILMTQSISTASDPDEFYYRMGEEGSSETTTAKEITFDDLTGEWINAKGDTATISSDGKVAVKGTDYFPNFDKYLSPMTEENGLYSGIYMSGDRFNNYYIYAPVGTHLIDKMRQNEDLGVDKENDRLILVRAESGSMSTPIEEFLFTRIKKKEEKDDTAETTSSSSKEKKETTSSSSTETSTSASSTNKAKETVSTETSETKKTTTSSTQQDGNTIQKIYQKVTGRKTLPSTGEAVSVLGLVGAALIGAGLYLARKRKKD